MGTETGITNITSSTAVRINYAYQSPFPNERASEDFHTWMRLSASGANFEYTTLVPTKYRIPSFMKYQASRTRIGPSNFNQIKTRVDCDGFSKAIEIALIRNIIKPEQIPMLKAKFYKRLAKSMLREMENEIASELYQMKLQARDSCLHIFCLISYPVSNEHRNMGLLLLTIGITTLDVLLSYCCIRSSVIFILLVSGSYIFCRYATLDFR